MTAEEMRELATKNPRITQSIAFDSIGKKFDYLGSICEAVYINDNGEVVLQEIYAIYNFYMLSISSFCDKLKNGDIIEVS